MHYTLLETRARITCTLEELVKMESLDQRIYAMPNLQGTVVQLYIANRPTSHDDFYACGRGGFSGRDGVRYAGAGGVEA